MRGLENAFVESVAVAMICPEPCKIFSSMNSTKLFTALIKVYSLSVQRTQPAQGAIVLGTVQTLKRQHHL